MNRPLWAPWRIEYIRNENKDKCFLCRLFGEQTDRDNLLLYRGETCAVVMNRFPYNNGHMMVAPYRHIAEPVKLTKEETLEMNELTSRVIEALRKTMNAEGFNVGINLGTVAGAGLKDHLHQHIVPRWAGDTNFMAVIGDTHVVPEALLSTYDLIAHALRST